MNNKKFCQKLLTNYLNIQNNLEDPNKIQAILCIAKFIGTTYCTTITTLLNQSLSATYFGCIQNKICNTIIIIIISLCFIIITILRTITKINLKKEIIIEEDMKTDDKKMKNNLRNKHSIIKHFHQYNNHSNPDIHQYHHQQCQVSTIIHQSDDDFKIFSNLNEKIFIKLHLSFIANTYLNHNYDYINNKFFSFFHLVNS